MKSVSGQLNVTSVCDEHCRSEEVMARILLYESSNNDDQTVCMHETYPSFLLQARADRNRLTAATSRENTANHD